MATLKPQSNGPLHINTAIGTLAVDGWAVTFGTARRGPAQSPPRCTKCNSPPINGQCTNFISFDVAKFSSASVSSDLKALYKSVIIIIIIIHNCHCSLKG